MENEPKTTAVSETATPKPTKTHHENNGIIIALVVSTLLGISGVVLGVTGLIKANEAINIAKNNSADEILADDASDEYVDTENDDENAEEVIDQVYITYNDGKDYIDIYDGTIDYYAYDAEDNDITKSVETDTATILNKIFNDLRQYATDKDYKENATWVLEIETNKDSYIASGEGSAPEWFTKLLEELNIEQNGYQSKNF